MKDGEFGRLLTVDFDLRSVPALLAGVLVERLKEIRAGIACQIAMSIDGNDKARGTSDFVRPVEVFPVGIEADAEITAGFERESALEPIIGVLESARALIVILREVDDGGVGFGLNLLSFAIGAWLNVDRDAGDGGALLDDALEIAFVVEIVLESIPGKDVVALPASKALELIRARHLSQAGTVFARTGAASGANSALPALIGAEDHLPVRFDCVNRSNRNHSKTLL